MATLGEFKSSAAKEWSAKLWDDLIDALDGRFGPLEEQLDVQKAATDAIVRRGLVVIEELLAPQVTEAGELVGDIETIKASAEVIKSAIQSILDAYEAAHLSADLVDETAGRKFLTAATRSELAQQLAGAIAAEVAARNAAIGSVFGALAIGDIAGLATALGAKAPLASPTFTNQPKAPTAAAGDASKLIATTEFVASALSTAIAAVLSAAKARRIGTSVTVNQSTPIADTLVEDGASYLAATYPELFAALVRFGAVTFNNGAGAYVNWPAHTVKNLDPVKFTTTGGLPTGLVAGTTYYARNPINGAFQLSATPTGSLLTLGASSTGVHRGINAPHGCANDLSTFNVPNSLGEFWRMWDGARGVDPARVFGSAQLDAGQGHWHGIVYDNSGTSAYVSGGGSGRFIDGSLQGSNLNVKDPISDGVNGTPRTAAETRPRNVAKLPCIYYQ